MVNSVYGRRSCAAIRSIVSSLNFKLAVGVHEWFMYRHGFFTVRCLLPTISECRSCSQTAPRPTGPIGCPALKPLSVNGPVRSILLGPLRIVLRLGRCNNAWRSQRVGVRAVRPTRLSTGRIIALSGTPLCEKWEETLAALAGIGLVRVLP